MQRKFSTNFAAPKQQDPEPDDAWNFDAPTFFDIKTYHETVQNKHFLDFALDPRVYTDFWFTYPHDYCEDSETESKSKPSTSTSAKESIPNRESRINPSLNTTHKDDNKKKVVITKGANHSSTVPNISVRRITTSCLNPAGMAKSQQQYPQTSTHMELKLQASISTTQNQLLLASHSKKRKEPFGAIENEYFCEADTTVSANQTKDGRRNSYVSKALKFSNHPEENNRRLSVADKIKMKTFSIVRNSDANSILNDTNSSRLAAVANRRKSKSLEKFTNLTADSADHTNCKGSLKVVKMKAKDDICSADEKITQAKLTEAKDSKPKSVQVVYEPAKFSARHVRKWEKLANKQWYLLTQQERHDANIQMDQMIKKGGICGITLPLYAYYWKITTMEGLNDGIRSDTKRIEKLGKTRKDIPKKVFRRKENEDYFQDSPSESSAQKKNKQKNFKENI